jgi:hypothetical protein
MSDHRSADEALAAAALDRFRQTGIRLDREGRFWHEGQEIEHDGMRRAFLGWLDRLGDGRYVLRLDAERFAYLEVDDAPLLVTSARWRGDRVYVVTNDGRERELDYASLRTAPDDALYCTVASRFGQPLDARVTTAAYYPIAERIEETAAGFALRAAGGLHPIGAR